MQVFTNSVRGTLHVIGNICEAAASRLLAVREWPRRCSVKARRSAPCQGGYPARWMQKLEGARSQDVSQDSKSFILPPPASLIHYIENVSGFGIHNSACITKHKRFGPKEKKKEGRKKEHSK